MIDLSSFGPNMRIAIIGASGGIGRALVDHLSAHNQAAQIFTLSRSGQSHPSPKVFNLTFDFTDEASITAAAEAMREAGSFDLILVATGLLQGQGISPEKNMRAMSYDGFAQSFLINTAGPAMTAKHMLPLLHRDRKTVFAALSARVGSISDNRLGGWYAYRASKAALNMVIKTLAIEYGRRFKQAAIIGLHPGTVDTSLSKPFQSNVPEGKLFTPDQSAAYLLNVVNTIEAADSGYLFDWDGRKVPA
jgi:NAD(P)-dependent dehydrogenase (short-subunit alcohol dehydrogenase family)